MDKKPKISCDESKACEAFDAVGKRAEKILDAFAGDLSDAVNADLRELIHEIDIRRGEIESWDKAHRHTQVELAQSRNRYDDLYDSVPVGLIALSLKGIISRANRSAEQLLAFPAAVLIGKGLSRWIHAKDHRRYFACLRKAIDSGQRQACEVRLAGKDKRYLHVRIEAGARFDESQNVTEWLLAISDAPERRRAEQVLQRRAHELREVLNSLTAIIGLMSPDGTLIEVNQAALAAADLSPEDLLGKPMEDCYWWAWSPEVQQRLCEAIELAAAGQGSRYQERIRVGEGELRTVDFKLTPIFGPDDHVAWLSASATDIAGGGQAQQEAEGSFRTAFEYTAEAIIALDMEQRCLEANSIAGFITGVPHQQLPGRFLTEFIDPSFDLSWAWQELLKTGWFSGEVPIRHSSGSMRLVKAAGYANIGPGRHLFVGHDITEYKQAEAALRDLNEKLKRQAAESTELAEARARQLRSLVSELTFAEQRERQRLAEVLHDHLQQLLVGAKINSEALSASLENEHKQAVETVLTLINRSIQTSRALTAELSPPPLKQGRLSGALEWLAKAMQEQHGLTVELLTDPSMDPQREDITVLLFESARELLFNVVKHAKVKAARLEMSPHQENRLRLAVVDQGVGFDPEAVWQKPQTGAGYGLSSIRERLELLGGELEVQSTPGKGASFALIVPFELIGKKAEESSEKRDGLSTKEQEAQLEDPPTLLISICVFCKRIRDDNGRWIQMEPYLHDSFGMEFTHGICPECARKNYPDYYEQ